MSTLKAIFDKILFQRSYENQILHWAHFINFMFVDHLCKILYSFRSQDIVMLKANSSLRKHAHAIYRNFLLS